MTYDDAYSIVHCLVYTSSTNMLLHRRCDDRTSREFLFVLSPSYHHRRLQSAELVRAC